MQSLEQQTIETDVVAQLAETWGDAPLDNGDPSWRLPAALAKLGRLLNDSSQLRRSVCEAARAAAETVAADHFGIARREADQPQIQFEYGSAADTHSRCELGPASVPIGANESLSAFAMQAGRLVVVERLSGESRFHDAILRELGVESAVVCPLADASGVFGTFGVYRSQPGAFSPQDVVFIDAAAQLMGSAIARDRTERTLHELSKVHSATIDTMEGIVLVLDPDGRILEFNSACERLSGFTIDELRGRHMCSAFLIPEEADVLHGVLDGLQLGTTPLRMESFLLTKHGQRRRVAWSFAVVRGERENVASIVGSGVDVTAQFVMLRELEHAEATGGRIKNVLASIKQRLREDNRPAQDTLPFSEATENTAATERRAHLRRPYPYVQVIAPLIGDELPGFEQYAQVRCRDISASGFSYFTAQPPQHELLVVAFGTYPLQIFLIAKVVHVSRFDVDGADAYVVGCRYTKRAHYPPTAGAPVARDVAGWPTS